MPAVLVARFIDLSEQFSYVAVYFGAQLPSMLVAVHAAREQDPNPQVRRAKAARTVQIGYFQSRYLAAEASGPKDQSAAAADAATAPARLF